MKIVDYDEIMDNVLTAKRFVESWEAVVYKTKVFIRAFFGNDALDNIKSFDECGLFKMEDSYIGYGWYRPMMYHYFTLFYSIPYNPAVIDGVSPKSKGLYRNTNVLVYGRPNYEYSRIAPESKKFVVMENLSEVADFKAEL